MPLSPEARKVWDSLVPRLSRIGLARSVDDGALARYCELFVLWHAAVKSVQSGGTKYAVRGEPRGEKPGRVLGFRTNPDVGIVSRLHRDLLAIEREFGLTPAARTRIRTEADMAAKGDPHALRSNFFATPAAATKSA